MDINVNLGRRAFINAILGGSLLVGLGACQQQDAGADSVPNDEPDESDSPAEDEPAPEPEPEPASQEGSARTVFLVTALNDSIAAHGSWDARESSSMVVYDEAGRVSHRVVDTGYAGYVISADYTYDVEGNVIGATLDSGSAGSDGSVAPFNSTWTAYWSDNGMSVSWESNETPYGSFYLFCNFFADGKPASKAVSLIGPQAGFEGSAEYIYNERGQLITVNETPGFGSRNTKEMAYDRSGRLISYTCEQDSESCTYSYNGQGKLIEKHHIIGSYEATTTIEYDADGIPVSAQRITSDPDNPEYDFKVRPQASCTFTCDDLGNITSGSRVVQADGLEDIYYVAYEVHELGPSDPVPYSAISLLDPTDPYPYLDEFYIITDFGIFSRVRAEEENARWLAENAAEVEATDAEIAAESAS